MKRIVVPIFLALSWCGCGSSEPDLPFSQMSKEDGARCVQAIRDQVADMHRKFIDGALDEYIDYMPEHFIELAEGRAAIKELIQLDMAQAAEQLESASLGDVSEIVDEEGFLAAFVPLEMLCNFPDGQYLRKGYYIASSTDDGKTWQFLSGQGDQAQDNYFRYQYPNLTQFIPFPECTYTKVK